MLPLSDLQDSCQCSIAVIVASCLTSQEQPHYRKHPDHLPPSQKAIPSPEGLTAQEVQSMQCSDLLTLLPFLSQGVDWFKLMISRFIFFFSMTSWSFRSWHYFHLQGFCLCEDTFLMSAISNLSTGTPPCTALFQGGLISVLTNTLHLSQRDITSSFKCWPFTLQNAYSL